ncbi:MAG: hypothetical protein FWD59_05095 [Micrococcales bacterium]|nr:hypothetical protein [Micrococcales bacterium]
MASHKADPGQDVAKGPYREDFISTLSALANDHDPGSEFVKRVLADGVVTPEEYSETVALVTQCMRDAGLTPVVHAEDGVTGFSLTEAGQPWPEGEEYPPAFDSCVSQWDRGVLALYAQMIVSPYGEPSDEEVVECLIHQGLAPQGFSALDLADMRDQATPECVRLIELPNGVKCEYPPADEQPNPILPGGHRFNSDEVLACLHNPRDTMAR